MTTGRLEAFSDGVFAIAATLLVLDLKAGVPLGRSLLHIWPSYVAYAISFVTLGIIWVNHHTMFALIVRVDRTFLVINVLFLMVVAFVPFPTGLVATHFDTQGLEAAALAYGATLTILGVLFNAVWFYAARGRRLLDETADPRAVSGISRSFLVGPAAYLAATLTALGEPKVAVGLFGALSVFYVIESSMFGQSPVREGPARPGPL